MSQDRKSYNHFLTYKQRLLLAQLEHLTGPIGVSQHFCMHHNATDVVLFRITTKRTGTQGQQGHITRPRPNPYPNPKLSPNPKPQILSLNPITHPIWCDPVSPVDPIRFAVTDSYRRFTVFLLTRLRPFTHNCLTYY